MSKPSLRSRVRSGLRAISWCDIEHHALLDLDAVSGYKAALWLVAMPPVVHDGVLDAVRRRREARQHEDLFERNVVLPDVLRSAIYNDDDGLALALLLLKLCLCH